MTDINIITMNSRKSENPKWSKISLVKGKKLKRSHEQYKCDNFIQSGAIYQN